MCRLGGRCGGSSAVWWWVPLGRSHSSRGELLTSFLITRLSTTQTPHKKQRSVTKPPQLKTRRPLTIHVLENALCRACGHHALVGVHGSATDSVSTCPQLASALQVRRHAGTSILVAVVGSSGPATAGREGGVGRGGRAARPLAPLRVGRDAAPWPDALGLVAGQSAPLLTTSSDPQTP